MHVPNMLLNFETILTDGKMNNIRKDKRRSHVKLDNILFYFFKKEKMK